MSGKKTKTKAKTKYEIKEEFNDELLRLRDQINRTTKSRLTTAQRCTILNDIYDSTLFALQFAIMNGINRGTSSAVHILERARLEMMELQRAQLEVKEAKLREDSNTTRHNIGWEYGEADQESPSA